MVDERDKLEREVAWLNKLLAARTMETGEWRWKLETLAKLLVERYPRDDEAVELWGLLQFGPGRGWSEWGEADSE
jgi:hypothetical protein